VLSPSLDGIRLALHVLAAAVWVGGQIVLVGLLPTLRQIGGDAPARVAQAFAKVAWPAFVVLIATGFWNLAVVHPSQQDTAWQVVLGVKLFVVVLSGVAVGAHMRAKSKSATAVWGATAGVTSIAALCMGIFLTA
jgi:putative copper export protein